MRYVVLSALIAFMGGSAMAETGAGESGLAGKVAIRVQRDTEKYRKGDAVIKVVDRRGRPIEGAAVKAEQLTHDFLFGCNIYRFDRLDTPEQNEKYKQLFKGIMNYATIAFYWAGFEPEQGKPRYGYAEEVARWCKENGITTKGHPLVWGCHEAGIPKWLPQDNPDEVKRLIEERIRVIVPRYKGLIDIWDVVNESTHGKTFAGMSVFDHTSLPIRWAEESNPEAMLIVNEYGVIGDTKGTGDFFKLLKEMNAGGVPYDTIGIQTHMHRGPMSLPLILETLDKFAELGKPMHFTETTVLSGKETNPEEEKTQAQYVEKFYRVCFSHPAVQAITWWDFSDAGAWQGVAAGLIRKDMSPKPVYLVLDRLINKEWHTSADGRTDADGSHAFRGFGGNYRIEVTTPSGETKTVEFHLAEQEDNAVEVRI